MKKMMSKILAVGLVVGSMPLAIIAKPEMMNAMRVAQCYFKPEKYSCSNEEIQHANTKIAKAKRGVAIGAGVTLAAVVAATAIVLGVNYAQAQAQVANKLMPVYSILRLKLRRSSIFLPELKEAFINLATEDGTDLNPDNLFNMLKSDPNNQSALARLDNIFQSVGNKLNRLEEAQQIKQNMIYHLQNKKNKAVIQSEAEQGMKDDEDRMKK